MSLPLPPFSSLLKSRDVEDPVNLWVHRPLAYAIFALIYRTPITPNQVTFLATLVGCTAGLCWFVGWPSAMLLGGILYWTSAILDGVDGILARAKNLQSVFGQNLDGEADLLVGLVTVGGAYYHIWLQRQEPWDLALALGTTILHVYTYEFYSGAFLNFTNPKWDGRPERLAHVKQRYEEVKKRRASWFEVIVGYLEVTMRTNQARVIALTNTYGRRDGLRYVVNEETARIYRRYNIGPMKLWPWISNAPHVYLMSICAMFDRLYLYLLFRAFVANAIFIVVLLWQRSASKRTLREWETIGAAPASAE
jgi:phosphatidylglycerophosphate synthase